MKSKLSSTFNKLRIIMVAALTVFCVSCDKTETTDTTGFILHYLGITDIGPSMSYTLKAPAYKGSTPYDFTITKITLDNESFSNNDNFVINSETGEITVQNTDEMKPGLYNISVGCYSNGKFFDFKDAVQVNMLLAVPEGVSVEPAEVLVKMEDENWWEASAKVTTDTEKHVSITKYEFAEDESKEYIKYFTISNTGVITFNPDHKDEIIPGEKYILSLKLTTKAGEHLYPDAVTFNVISKPLNLLYKPNTVRVEQNTAHESQIPTIQGSKGMTYAIKSVTPEVAGFTIDETTGKISLAENSTLEIGNVYKIDVTVTNEYGSADFAEAYTVTIVDYIEPIDPETFKYVVPETYEEKAYKIPVDPKFKGDEAIFSFTNNTGIIQEHINNNKITIDPVSGTISITADNTLAPGNYKINVKVVGPTEDKGEATTTVVLEIKANPNKFTLYYGNNIGLNTVQHANQFAYSSKDEMDNAELIPTVNFLTNTTTPNIKWEYQIKDLIGGNKSIGVGKDAVLDTQTGKITLSKNGYTTGSMNMGLIIVKATAGDEDLAYSVTTPIFIRCNVEKNGVFVKYSPFVFKVNPKIGGWSEAPIIEKPTDHTTLKMDFRKDINYFNIEITDNPKGLTPTSSPLKEVWDSFFADIDKTVSYSSIKPISYYNTDSNIDNKSITDRLLGYVDPISKAIRINPEKWKNEKGEYINGILFARIAYTTDGTIPNSQVFYPIAIWFDETYGDN